MGLVFSNISSCTKVAKGISFKFANQRELFSGTKTELESPVDVDTIGEIAMICIFSIIMYNMQHT